MNFKKVFIPILLFSTILVSACVYIVLPEGIEDLSVNTGGENLGWSGIVTGVGESESGSLRIDITIRNDTGDWSTMQADEDKPGVLTTSDGRKTDCETVYIETGGHRLAPGFQMRGFTYNAGGTQEIQLLYVVCEGAEVEAPWKVGLLQ